MGITQLADKATDLVAEETPHIPSDLRLSLTFILCVIAVFRTPRSEDAQAINENVNEEAK